VAEIDRLNILRAALLAMCRAVARLPAPPDLALVDGNIAPALACPVRCVVGGDARCLSIAAASIVAKVVRDRAMARLAVRWPGYGWETNVGYATEFHRAALLRLGATRHHRPAFASVAQLVLDLQGAALATATGVLPEFDGSALP
jgi:ribonuclease HII